MLSVTTGKTNGTTFHPIGIREGNLIVKNLFMEREIVQAYHLRHKIFAQKLKWVSETENMLEIDVYDNYAIHFGVLDLYGKVWAYMRLITTENTFMLEKEFLPLVGHEHEIRKEADTAELSRCCIASEARRHRISNEFGSFDIFSLLFKGIYQWCSKNNVRYLYGVTDHRVYKLLHMKGFSFALIDKPYTMPDGVVAVAVMMDWREFEILNALKRPDMLKWFTQYQSIPVQQHAQRHETCLKHQASEKYSLYGT